MSNLKMWKQKDGTKIRIKDMTDVHLFNTIRFLLRSAGNQRMQDLLYFPSFQGEMAQYYVEQEWDELNDMTDFEYAELEYPIFNDLVKDAKRRKLNFDKLGV